MRERGCTCFCGDNDAGVKNGALKGGLCSCYSNFGASYPVTSSKVFKSDLTVSIAFKASAEVNSARSGLIGDLSGNLSSVSGFSGFGL